MSANLHSYDADIIAWANEQARLLREGQFSKLDIEHIAEEIEDVGKSEKRELRNSMAVLLAHLLKWQYQPGYPGQQLAADDQGTAPGCPRMLEGNAKPKTRPWQAGLVGMGMVRRHRTRPQRDRAGLFPRVLPVDLRANHGRGILAFLTGWQCVATQFRCRATVKLLPDLPDSKTELLIVPTRSMRMPVLGAPAPRNLPPERGNDQSSALDALRKLSASYGPWF